jgi:hypothetical protein
MGNVVKVVTLKGYRELNGRQVPIYKTSWVSKVEYQRATQEAAKRIAEEQEKAMKEEELVEVLKGHAEEVSGVPAVEVK